MSWTKTRSELANALRVDPDANVDDLRAQLKAERLEVAIRRAVAEAPTLSDEQRSRLAQLLRPERTPARRRVAAA